MASSRAATLFGMGAILLWASLATLTTLKGPIPPFQTTAMVFTIGATVAALREEGPTLGRPLVDRLKATKIHHLKELRPGSKGRSEIRIIFAFDRTRSALLLLGGDKAGNWERWKGVGNVDDGPDGQSICGRFSRQLGRRDLHGNLRAAWTEDRAHHGPGGRPIARVFGLNSFLIPALRFLASELQELHSSKMSPMPSWSTFQMARTNCNFSSGLWPARIMPTIEAQRLKVS